MIKIMIFNGDDSYVMGNVFLIAPVLGKVFLTAKNDEESRAFPTNVAV